MNLVPVVKLKIRYSYDDKPTDVTFINEDNVINKNVGIRLPRGNVSFVCNFVGMVYWSPPTPYLISDPPGTIPLWFNKAEKAPGTQTSDQ